VRSWLPGRTWADIRFQARPALTFQLLVQLVAFALGGPLLTWVGRHLVLAAGEPAVSNFDIAGFLLSPMGLFSLLIIAALAGGALLAELAGQSWIAGHAVARRPVTLSATVAAVLLRVPALLLLSARVFVRLCTLALPFLAGAVFVWYTLLRAHDINYYLAAHPSEWRRALRWALLLGTGYGLVAIWQLTRWLFAVPILLFEKMPPLRALTESARRTRGRLLRIVAPLLAWWMSLVVLALVAATGTHSLETKLLEWAGLDLHRVLPLIALFVVVGVTGAFLHNALLIVGHQFLVTRMYVEQLEPHRWQELVASSAARDDSRPLGRRFVAATALLLAIGLGSTWAMLSRHNPETAVAVTAHRGASSQAPENTLAAFRAAMDAHADYSELDVQRTRDGQVVVLHDRDLMRMAGDPRRIGELTMTDLAGIDIGAKYGTAFRGEHVPSLESVIDLVRGRMKLNVELKYNAPDPGLAAAVVDILRRRDFLEHVVITSLDAAALRQVKAIEPRLKTGLIVTGALGDVAHADADFLSLNSARATPSMIHRAHAVGKQVHVWTVNRTEVMLRLIERGVDNIITNYPELTVGIIRQRATLSPAELLALRLRVLFGEPPPELVDPASVTVL
jgi:glycerophosphoryl diester phosphodiesterase